MTTAKVTQAGLYPGNVNQTSSQTANTQTDEFSKIFASRSAQTNARTTDQTSLKDEDVETGKEQTADVKKESEASKTENTDTAETKRSAEEVQPDEKTQEAKNTEAEDAEEGTDTEAVMEAIAQIMGTIREVLDVTPEQINEAMEELGLTAEELLDADNIPKLVVALTEGADELSVMTDAGLFADVQTIAAEVETVVNELTEELGVTKEQLREMFADMTQTEEVPEEETTVMTGKDTADDLPSMEETRVQIPVERADVPQRETKQQVETDHSPSGEQMSFAQTVTEQIEQAVAQTEGTYTEYAQTREIMDQIRDVIRVIQSQDVTEMELQLHPASLGHVKVQLSMQQGVLTATFTTENEAVKSALESQMLVLKENFEQQGIKVEAVEVTVASHAFEQNLSNSENAAREEQEPEKKKNIRKLSLSDLLNETAEEELSEEDRIVAEMMKQNGNTVDYTV